MGLIQGVIEKSGIPTVSVTMLREVTERVRPPRALFVDTPLGYPLGRPHDRELQMRILESALDLLHRSQGLPLLEQFQI